MKYKTLTIALLSTVSAVSFKSSSNLNQQTEALTELNRYIGANGQPINLAETTGHARIQLDPVIRQNTPSPTLYNQKPIQQNMYRQSLESQGDASWVADICIGNPPQKIKALFDTGSANMWVVNKMTDLGVNNKYKVRSYDEKASTTAKQTGQPAKVQFGKGTIEGNFFTDDVIIGGCNAKPEQQLHVKNQMFGSIVKQQEIFDGQFDALIGLAYPIMAETGVTPLFDTMINQKQLKENIFAFYLTTTDQAKYGNLFSELTFGYYDKSKFEGDISWHQVTNQQMFNVPLENIEFNGKMSDVCKNSKEKCLITFDSGTTLMSMPEFATTALAQQGVPVGGKVKKCHGAETYGSMAFIIGGKRYELLNGEWMWPAKPISASQMVQGGLTSITFRQENNVGPQMLAQIDNDEFLKQDEIFDEDLLQAEADVKAGKKIEATLQACSSIIQSVTVKDNIFIVGEMFMKKFYTIFDRTNNRIGLAKSHGYP